MSLIAVIVIVVIGLFFVYASIRVLREYERGVVFTLGRYTGTKGPASFCWCLSFSKWCVSICALSSMKFRRRT